MIKIIKRKVIAGTTVLTPAEMNSLHFQSAHSKLPKSTKKPLPAV